jgi:signal peptidase I
VGMVVAFGTLVLPILWPAALVLGILLIVRRSVRAGVVTLLLGAVVLPAIGIALWQAFIVKPYRTASASMQPALEPGERFIMLKLDQRPSIGEIVVFNAPRGADPGVAQRCGALDVPVHAMCPESTAERSDRAFVMRVVGAGGDRIHMRGGRIVRNDAPESGYEIRGCGGIGCNFSRAITVPDGQVFLLGDNRASSFDARFWGPVPEEWIQGRYWFSYAGR